MLQINNREILQFNDYRDIVMVNNTTPCSFPEHWHLSSEFIILCNKKKITIQIVQGM